jgi:hypothetical protein
MGLQRRPPEGHPSCQRSCTSAPQTASRPIHGDPQMTMELRGDRYVVTTRNGFEPPNFRSVWTVEAFTPQQVIIHRHDSSSPANPQGKNGWDVVYTGYISEEGTSLKDITANGKPSPGMRLTWGRLWIKLVEAMRNVTEQSSALLSHEIRHPPKSVPPVPNRRLPRPTNLT